MNNNQTNTTGVSVSQDKLSYAVSAKEEFFAEFKQLNKIHQEIIGHKLSSKVIRNNFVSVISLGIIKTDKDLFWREMSEEITKLNELGKRINRDLNVFVPQAAPKP